MNATLIFQVLPAVNQFFLLWLILKQFYVNLGLLAYHAAFKVLKVFSLCTVIRLYFYFGIDVLMY